jgi:hypothetical protein
MRELQDVIVSRYPGNRRPKNPESMHCPIYPEHLRAHEDMLQVIERSLLPGA